MRAIILALVLLLSGCTHQVLKATNEPSIVECAPVIEIFKGHLQRFADEAKERDPDIVQATTSIKDYTCISQQEADVVLDMQIVFKNKYNTPEYLCAHVLASLNVKVVDLQTKVINLVEKSIEIASFGACPEGEYAPTR